MKQTRSSSWSILIRRSPALRRACSWLAFIILVMALMPSAGPRLAAQAPAVPIAADPAAPAPGPDVPKSDAPKANHEIGFSNPLELMRMGGFAMWPVAVCSVVMAAFFFERLIALRRGRVIPKPFVRRILPQIRSGELDQHEALELCEENRSPIAQIFAGAVTKWGRPAVEVEQAIVDAGERATFSLRKNLRVFSAVHTLGPLLGLVGTVFGIIKAFNALSVKGAEDRAQLLANGIAQALLATAFGLIVAIPALLCYLWFLSKADTLTHEMDRTAQELVGMISLEGQHSRPAPESRSSKPRRAGRPESAQ